MAMLSQIGTCLSDLFCSLFEAKGLGGEEGQNLNLQPFHLWILTQKIPGRKKDFAACLGVQQIQALVNQIEKP